MPVKKKVFAIKRTSENGFDLDLTYIKPNIIAMGFPYENFEGLFKSHGMNEVVRFLDLHHSKYYRVYNLCSERSYDSSKFHMRAISYPFDVNCPPPFEVIQKFCEDMSAFLKANHRNIAVVHCCDGVQRAGVMICSYLLHDQIFDSTSDALQFFAAARTHDGVGIIIPSQRRYVQYYGYMIKNNITYSSNTVYLQSLKFLGTPCMQAPCFTVSMQNEIVHTSKIYDHIKRSVSVTEFLLPQQLPLWGDVSIRFFHQTRFVGKEDMFTFCFNAYFVNMHLLLQQRQQGCMQAPAVCKRSLLTPADSDGSATEMDSRAQSNSPMLTAPSQSFQSPGIRKSASLTDLCSAVNDLIPIITCGQRSSSGSNLSSAIHQSSFKPKPRLQSTSFNLLPKKTLPDDKQLKRALNKAGKYAGIDITTGFTTVVHKPKDDRIPRKIPQDASNPTQSPSTRRMYKFMSADLSLSHRELVTIVAPLCELDHAARHIPDDFQLHIILSVDAGLIKNADDSKYSDRL